MHFAKSDFEIRLLRRDYSKQLLLVICCSIFCFATARQVAQNL